VSAVWDCFVANVDLFAFIGVATVVLTGLLAVAMVCDWAGRRLCRVFRRPVPTVIPETSIVIPKAPPPMPHRDFNFTLPRRHAGPSRAEQAADGNLVVAEAIRACRNHANH
jgi:hypothetical protein